MSSKKKSKTSTSSTQTSAPPDFTAPGLAQTAGMVTNALGQIPTSHYSGQQVAYMSPAEQAAIQAAWGNTAGLAGNMTDYMGNRLPELGDLWDWQTSLPTASFNMGQMTDVNPVIDAALHPVYEQLMNQILPGMQSSALDAGAYSGDRAMRVLPTDAISEYTDSASRTAATIGYENYRDYENRRLAAWAGDQDRLLAGYGAETQRGLGQNASQTAMMGAEADYIANMLRNSASVGDLLNMSAQLGVTNQQAQFNDAIARDKYASYSPFMGLDQASQLLTMLSGGYGTQTGQATSKTTEKTGGLGEWVKGAIGLGSMAAGAFGLNPLAAMGMGAAAGGGGSGISVTPNATENFLKASSIFG